MSAADLFRRTDPITGAVRIDPLVGTRPTWREGDTPIYDVLVAELGDPFAPVAPEPEPAVEDGGLAAVTAAAEDDQEPVELLRLVRSIDTRGRTA